MKKLAPLAILAMAGCDDGIPREQPDGISVASLDLGPAAEVRALCQELLEHPTVGETTAELNVGSLEGKPEPIRSTFKRRFRADENTIECQWFDNHDPQDIARAWAETENPLERALLKVKLEVFIESSSWRTYRDEQQPEDRSGHAWHMEADGIVDAVTVTPGVFAVGKEVLQTHDRLTKNDIPRIRALQIEYRNHVDRLHRQLRMRTQGNH